MDEPTIERLAVSAATDPDLVERLVRLVDAAYVAAEHGLWRVPLGRTNVDEMHEWIVGGKVVAAWVKGAVVGSVTSHLTDPATGWFGALAVDPAFGGRGIASGLVRLAERDAAASGAVAMRLELLQPDPPHAHQNRLRAWYTAIGYQPAGRLELAEIDADAVRHARFPMHAVVMRKSLTAVAAGDV